MAYFFGDGFDCYSAVLDAVAGYWDGGDISGGNGWGLGTGRFANSRAVVCGLDGTNLALFKVSNQNDNVHHIVCSVFQANAISGSSSGTYFQFLDGLLPQCCVVFRSDGAMLLTNGAHNGAILATYTGAINSTNTWYAFEFEIVIHNTAGSFTVRKNGNNVNDFTAGSLNTRNGTTNNYANRLGVSAGASNGQRFDDVLWRSDASSVPWVGDIRCYTRLPAADVSKQFTPAPTIQTLTRGNQTFTSDNAGTAHYSSFTASFTGTIATIIIQLNVAMTGNMKMAMFSDNLNSPGTILGSATTLVNPPGGNNLMTFPTPIAVTRGVVYWFGVQHDAACTFNVLIDNIGKTGTGVTYGSFPADNPIVITSSYSLTNTTNITVTVNAEQVNEALQDGTATYVYDTTVGHADFYTVAPLTVTPASVLAVITRGFVEKSDAGLRAVAVQLKSGSTTMQSPAPALSTSFGWLWRADTVDPATGVAWTPASVNNVQIGPIITA